jgi:hypothetical protein
MKRFDNMRVLVLRFSSIVMMIMAIIEKRNGGFEEAIYYVLAAILFILWSKYL